MNGDGCLGGLFGLVFFGGLIGFLWMLLSSSAVLYSESPSNFGGFTCSYFTGLRTVETYNLSSTGCPRFIKVGE